MKIINIEKIENLKNIIDSFEVNVKYLFPINFKYKWVSIDKNSHGEFTWTMEFNNDVCHLSGYVFPYGKGNNVAYFKTEKGTKNNLFKKLQNLKYND